MSEIDSGIQLERGRLVVHEPADPLYPNVFVAKLKAKDRVTLAQGKPVKVVKLGNDQRLNFQLKLTESMVQNLQTELMRQADDAYILLWDGNKIPRGVRVGGHTIGWTQNGQVLSDKGQMLGVYDRILEWGGESKKEQQMIVFLTAKPVEQSEVK